MKIFVTGGSGFLGKHLVNRLKVLGHSVDAPPRRLFDLMSQDISRVSFGSFAVVIHLAAMLGGIGFNQANPVRCLNENLIMSTTLFQALDSRPPPKFIALGSV